MDDFARALDARVTAAEQQERNLADKLADLTAAINNEATARAAEIDVLRAEIAALRSRLPLAP